MEYSKLSCKMKIVLVLLIFCFLGSDCHRELRSNFPEDFHFGVGTAAYQIEGAWDEDGKGESIWDRWLHTRPELFANGPNGDKAVDSYHRMNRDIQMLRQLGVDHYRFSIAWTRILPTGFANNVNEKGLAYYEKLIDQLLKHDIEPIVVMYHHDLPQKLQDLGGWANPLIADWFEDYARVLFDNFFDKVKYWFTIHDPGVCFESYGGTSMAPGIGSRGIGDYLCVKHKLIAHARAYRLNKEYQKKAKEAEGKEKKEKKKGKDKEKKKEKDKERESYIGLSVIMNYADAEDPKSKEDKYIAHLYRHFSHHIYVHPIYSKKGGWPEEVQQFVNKSSKDQGYPSSRLPEFTEEEKKLLRQSSDMLGLGHYTSHHVRIRKSKSEKGIPVANPDLDDLMVMTQSDTWVESSVKGMRSAPFGLYMMLMEINMTYEYPIIMITEFGWPTHKGLNDTETRVQMLKDYIKSLLLAHTDGSDIWGLTIFSLMDGIQWTRGSTERYGLFETDFEDPDFKCKPRASALYLRYLIENYVNNIEWYPKEKPFKLNVYERKERKAHRSTNAQKIKSNKVGEL